MDPRFRGDDRVEEEVKWLKTSEKATLQAIPEANPSTPLRTGARRSYVCFYVPSDGRWLRYRGTMERIAEVLVRLEG